MNVKKLANRRIGQKKIKTSVLLIAAVVLVVLSALIGGLLWNYGGKQQVVLQVGDSRINQAEYDSYIGSASKLKNDKNQAREDLIDYYKNKEVADKFDLPMNDLFIDEQWNAVVTELSTDSFMAEKLYNSEDEKWAHVLKYNKLYETLARTLTREAAVGAVYHIPYSGVGKATAEKLATDIQEEIKAGSVNNLTVDAEILNGLPARLQQLSASKFGAYLLFEDSSGLRIGGAFGVRSGVIPAEMANTIFSKKLPHVTDVIDVPSSAFYVIHAIEKFKADESTPEKLETEKNNIRVVEYDK